MNAKCQGRPFTIVWWLNGDDFIHYIDVNVNVNSRVVVKCQEKESKNCYCNLLSTFTVSESWSTKTSLIHCRYSNEIFNEPWLRKTKTAMKNTFSQPRSFIYYFGCALVARLESSCWCDNKKTDFKFKCVLAF
jgi:hypothetical protein